MSPYFQILIPIGLIILGLVSGYLINYLADVLPYYRRFTRPFCTTCFEPKSVFEFITQLFKYKQCGHSRSFRVVITLLATICITFWIWYFPPEKHTSLLGYILFLYFGLVAIIDLEHKLILHPVSIFGAILCGYAGIVRNGILSTIMGGVAGFAFMFGLYLLGVLFVRWIRKRRGDDFDEVALGFGDVNLAGIVGLLVGWPGIVAGLVFAILLGGAGSLIYLIWMVVARRYESMAAIPYGPFIIVAAMIILFMS